MLDMYWETGYDCYPPEEMICELDQIKCNKGEIHISKSGMRHDVVVGLEEELMMNLDLYKVMILDVAKNINKMDNAAKRFFQEKWNEEIDFEIGCIYIDSPENVMIDYWGTKVNTQFDVTFKYEGGVFTLIKWNMIETNIPIE